MNEPTNERTYDWSLQQYTTRHRANVLYVLCIACVYAFHNFKYLVRICIEWHSKWCDTELKNREKCKEIISHYLILGIQFLSYFFHLPDRHVRVLECAWAWVCSFVCAYFISRRFSIHSTFHLLTWTSLSLYFDSFTQISNARSVRAHGMWCHSWKPTTLYMFVCVMYVSTSISGIFSANLVNVCVCVTERERARERARIRIYVHG